MTSLQDILSVRTREGQLYRVLDSDFVECFACGHRCKIRSGRDGICRIRKNVNQTLMVPAGYVAGIQLDPIEKKPFFHAYPGTQTLSFGMLGCDLHCAYCQNWITSQALKDDILNANLSDITAQQIADIARRHRSPIITSTYNEPLITAEWAVDVFAAARPHGVTGAFVSNGNATPEVLEFIRPYVDFYKVDLKSFDDKQYRHLGTTLQNVQDSIRRIFDMGFWLEVVTLIIPGFNDSDVELQNIAGFLSDISPDIPWHVTAFHPDYKMMDHTHTPADTLARAAEIAVRCGVHFVYAGNLPGRSGTLENTYCPSCHALLVERIGFRVLANRIVNGACPQCQAPIPGVW